MRRIARHHPFVIILFIVFVIGLFFWGTYNRLVTLDQNVNKKWGDVQTVYQRRADLIPNLVNTVQGAANFEKSTIVEVTNARASVGRVQLDPSKAPTDAKQLEEFQAAQGQLSNALSRLLVVVERYPELKSNQNFLGLQAQLEGTENRISVERNNSRLQYRRAPFSDQHDRRVVWLFSAAVLCRPTRRGKGANRQFQFRLASTCAFACSNCSRDSVRWIGRPVGRC